jgi:uncharacterized protein YyaL (SSP411 family)
MFKCSWLMAAVLSVSVPVDRIGAEEKVPAEKAVGEKAVGEKAAGEKAAGEGAERKANRLAQEKSPYLLQHAYNPVDWYAWGPEAFEKAKQEDKPIFLSIGYSTCHWCHVMARESFENEEIAEFLNTYFVAIKVDREERPDVDAVYMAACQAQTRKGGWPLSAFLFANGKPFLTGTYFPPYDDPQRGKGFLTLCGQIVEAWTDKREAMTKSGDRLAEKLRLQSAYIRKAGAVTPVTLRKAFAAFRKSYDSSYGGFAAPPNHAPKFPTTLSLDFLLRYAVSRIAVSDDTTDAAEAMVYGTLDAMIRGGIRDHLAGGFHRYSVDREWLVPHFEKMLYDQALIARSLAHAYRRSGNETYRDVARETLDYVLTRMTGPSGEIYSAEDADTDHVEGKTYAWRRDEIIEVLGEERGKRFADFYGATADGNFEHGDPNVSVLAINLFGGVEELARNLEKPPAEVEAELVADRAKLLAVRDRRPQPFRDDKVLTEWNGWAISALAQVYQITGDQKYVEAAGRTAAFILEKMKKGGKLQRCFRQGEVRVDAFLEDYAALIGGLLDLYESGFQPRWLEEAVRLGKEMVQLFEDKKQGGFFSSSGAHETLFVQTKDFYDGAVPSGNSMAYRNLLRLQEFTGDRVFKSALARMDKIASAKMDGSARGSALLLCGLSDSLAGIKEIVIVGAANDPLTQAMVKESHRRSLPAKILLQTDSAETAAKLSTLVPLLKGKSPLDGKPTAFVCRDRVCKLPAQDLETFRQQLEAE